MCGEEKYLYKIVTYGRKYFCGLIGNKYWIGVVENYSRYSWSFFTKIKSQQPKNMEEFFEKMMSCGMPVKYLRFDNAGEQQSKLQRPKKKEKITSEYTTPHTP